ncbi:MAG: hypothetical protein AAGG47_01445 [Pseudomonadota bacterium]
MARLAALSGHGLVLLILTLATQIGGIAWLIAAVGGRRLPGRLTLFTLAYAALWLGATIAAPALGRQPLPCLGPGPLVMQSPLYCVLNRHYARPETVAVLEEAAAAVAHAHPGTQTLILDAGFPYLDGFPMVPHLSHRDGLAADIAFWYRDDTGFLPGRTRSPIGYFAFEAGPTDCPPRWLTLRWDLAWLQPLWPDWQIEPARLRTALRHLTADRRVSRLLLEPHLTASLGLKHPKIRFQGCRAARHDDHIHLQLHRG